MSCLSRPHEGLNRLLAEAYGKAPPRSVYPISCRPVDPLGVACTAGGSLTTSIRTITVFGSALLSYIRPQRGGRTLFSTKTVASRPGARLPCCRCGTLCEDDARMQAAPVSSLGTSCHRSYFGSAFSWPLETKPAGSLSVQGKAAEDLAIGDGVWAREAHPPRQNSKSPTQRRENFTPGIPLPPCQKEHSLTAQ
jgi:hypothetical protein